MVLKSLDAGNLPNWAVMKAPADAAKYYDLDPEKATFRDILLSIRADEAVHRSSNHHFSDIPSNYDIESDIIQISGANYKQRL